MLHKLKHHVPLPCESIIKRSIIRDFHHVIKRTKKTPNGRDGCHRGRTSWDFGEA